MLNGGTLIYYLITFLLIILFSFMHLTMSWFNHTVSVGAHSHLVAAVHWLTDFSRCVDDNKIIGWLVSEGFLLAEGLKLFLLIMSEALHSLLSR